jgi:hypothetical protein
MNYLLTVGEYKKLLDEKKLQSRKVLKKHLKKEELSPIKQPI